MGFIERSVLAGVLLAATVGLTMVVQYAVNWRQNRIVGRTVPQTQPTILYFWGPRCTTCKQLQVPALHALKEELGDRVVVESVDATVEVARAQAFKVLTVPTTVVLRNGQVAAINNGFASKHTLQTQAGL
ncbi:MAG: hypothetical protein NVS2B7_06180 [Herpetosiphon sp.]